MKKQYLCTLYDSVYKNKKSKNRQKIDIFTHMYVCVTVGVGYIRNQNIDCLWTWWGV